MLNTYTKSPKLCTVHSLSLIKDKNSIDIHCVKGQHAENFKVKVGQAKKIGDYHHCVVQYNSCLTSQSLLEETFLFRLEILLTDFHNKHVFIFLSNVVKKLCFTF